MVYRDKIMSEIEAKFMSKDILFRVENYEKIE